MTEWTSEVVNKLEEKIGYKFKNAKLLKTAFTHSTYANIHGGENNERLEFLGDAVLGFVVAETLYHSKANGKDLSEGEMTKMRAEAVSKTALLNAVNRAKLKDFLLFEGNENNVGEKTVSSIFETVVGAIYLDGGYDEAKKFIRNNLVYKHSESYKNELQEWTQAKKMGIPDYDKDCTKTGPDNAPQFTVNLTFDNLSASGKGKTKTQAENEAAKVLLEKLKEKYSD